MPAATLLQLTLVALALSSVVYALLATAKVAAFHRRLAHKTNEPRGEAVTVLKPLCGEDPELYENLCSFCLQDHDRFQILFGVREEDDPAVAVVHEVMARFPELDLKLVVAKMSFDRPLQLPHCKDTLHQTRRADRMSAGDQSARGIDRTNRLIL